MRSVLGRVMDILSTGCPWAALGRRPDARSHPHQAMIPDEASADHLSNYWKFNLESPLRLDNFSLRVSSDHFGSELRTWRGS